MSAAVLDQGFACLKRESEVKAEDVARAKIQKTGEDQSPAVATVAATATDAATQAKNPPLKTNARAREIRLEQNRKAARESRRRKKVMIEELQRSVIFFSRANATLKQQNDEFTRILMQAQMQIAAAENHKGHNGAGDDVPSVILGGCTITNSDNDQKPEEQTRQDEEAQVRAIAAATQAMYESKGYSAAAARAAAQAMSGKQSDLSDEALAAAAAAAVAAAGQSHVSQPPLPPMQTGSTMQAMANFQQAAAAAMQSAMGQMQNVPGLSLHQLTAPPAGANAQQAYTDTMTAFAMQQAAAAAMMQSGMQFAIHPMFAPWSQHPYQSPQPVGEKQDACPYKDAAGDDAQED